MTLMVKSEASCNEKTKLKFMIPRIDLRGREGGEEGYNIPTNCEGQDRDATHVRSADASYPQPHPAPIKDEDVRSFDMGIK